MSGDGREGDEQAERESRNDGLSPYAPVCGVMEQVTNRAQIPLLADLVAFKAELPKKPPWHPLLIPLR